MAQTTGTTEVDPAYLRAAQGMWGRFTLLAKCGGVTVAAILLFLLVFVY